MKIKIFADGADIAGIKNLTHNSMIKGFTTNPTLMRAAGITDYEAFAKDVIEVIGDKPISLEVFSDDMIEMDRQARKLSLLGSNVFVKIPITNTKQESTLNLVRNLSADGIKLNVTALMTLPQVESTVSAFMGGVDGCISVFAGRIADTGVDPLPIMKESLNLMASNKSLELIWASPREILNIVQADEIGCHIITVTHDLLKKMSNIGKDLNEFSLDTVKMFFDDASKAGYLL
jgi:transaldolase